MGDSGFHVVRISERTEGQGQCQTYIGSTQTLNPSSPGVLLPEEGSRSFFPFRGFLNDATDPPPFTFFIFRSTRFPSSLKIDYTGIHSFNYFFHHTGVFTGMN